MILVWSQPDPPVLLRWRGFDSQTQARVASAPLTPLAAVIGAPGEQGPPGRDGVDGAAQIPAVLDGGNF